MKLTAADVDVGIRLDALLANYMPEQSRAYWQKAIEAGYVQVNGKPTDKKYKLAKNDQVEVKIPDLPTATYDLPILYEDDNVIVFNKPAGVLTHSKGAFNPEATVASVLQNHISPISKAGPWKLKKDGLINDRSGIVHRLDRDTSGVIIVAKNEEAQVYLQRQFAARKVRKVYVAVVDGQPKLEEAILDWPIERNPKKPQTFRVGPNGKPSQTHYKVLCSTSTQSLLRLEPATGRTHQLRVHAAHMHTPIIGDKLYNPAVQNDSRLMLHAYELALRLPGSADKSTFQAPIPSEFEELCDV